VDDHDLQPTAEAYAETRAAFLAFAREFPENLWDASVPATPKWTARQLIAHLVGALEDFNESHFPTPETFAHWTADQVERRRTFPIESILSDWDAVAGAIMPKIEAGQIVPRPLINDTAVHEQDLRGLAGMPGGREGVGYRFALNTALTYVSTKITEAGLPALDILAEPHQTSDSLTQPDAPLRSDPALHERPDQRPSTLKPDKTRENLTLDAPGTHGWKRRLGDREPTLTVKVDPFELHRALFGRRSRDQMRAFAWSGDPEPYMAIIPVFGPTETDILE
jgi:hypothetical protein